MDNEWQMHSIGVNEHDLTSITLDICYYDSDQWPRLCACLGVNHTLTKLILNWDGNAEYDKTKSDLELLFRAVASIPTLQCLKLTGFDVIDLGHVLSMPLDPNGDDTDEQGDGNESDYDDAIVRVSYVDRPTVIGSSRSLKSIETEVLTSYVSDHLMFALSMARFESIRLEMSSGKVPLGALVMDNSTLKSLSIDPANEVTFMEDFCTVGFIRTLAIGMTPEPGVPPSPSASICALRVLNLNVPISVLTLARVGAFLEFAKQGMISFPLEKLSVDCNASSSVSSGIQLEMPEFDRPAIMDGDEISLYKVLKCMLETLTPAPPSTSFQGLTHFFNSGAITSSTLQEYCLKDSSMLGIASQIADLKKTEIQMLRNNYLLKEYSLFHCDNEPTVSFYLDLNRAGRRRLMGSERSETTEGGDRHDQILMEILVEQSNNLDCLYFFIGQNPDICCTGGVFDAITSQPESRVDCGQQSCGNEEISAATISPDRKFQVEDESIRQPKRSRVNA